MCLNIVAEAGSRGRSCSSVRAGVRGTVNREDEEAARTHRPPSDGVQSGRPCGDRHSTL